ncbi:mannosyltransferase family protein [Dactylosporangium sp. NPDC051541]|uniref:mannosyltransferase family protein n=1 Tax=Dactylosporangium sp. NPDC051541 TaxID=3363977 RepID=UPI0037AE4203
MRLSAHWRYAILLFVVSQAALSILGTLARQAFDAAGGPPAGETMMRADQDAVSSHGWYSMWFAWDSFQYRNLAEVPWGQWEHLGFPLLYPVLAKALAVPLGGDTELALLLIADAAYIVLLAYLYRWSLLVLGESADDEAARRTARLLVLMPTAFLFHAALTEALFVCLAVVAFYHAERGQWIAAGVAGYFLALSRSVGFLVVIPLVLLLVTRSGRRFEPKALALVLVPAGWLTFMAYSRWRVGDWFAYQEEQRRGWGIELTDPLWTLWHGVSAGTPLDRTRTWFAVAVLALAVAGAWRLHPAYAVYTVVLVLAALSIGVPVYRSLLRYLLVAFPLAAVLARWTVRREVETALTALLAVTQGALFVLWLAYWTHTII